MRYGIRLNIWFGTAVMFPPFPSLKLRRDRREPWGWRVWCLAKLRESAVVFLLPCNDGFGYKKGSVSSSLFSFVLLFIFSSYKLLFWRYLKPPAIDLFAGAKGNLVWWSITMFIHFYASCSPTTYLYYRGFRVSVSIGFRALRLNALSGVGCA